MFSDYNSTITSNSKKLSLNHSESINLSTWTGKMQETGRDTLFENENET